MMHEQLKLAIDALIPAHHDETLDAIVIEQTIKAQGFEIVSTAWLNELLLDTARERTDVYPGSDNHGIGDISINGPED